MLLAIARCRTAALGGPIDECVRCGHRVTNSYNNCRNRHCPKCQTAAREPWLEARRRELLASRYLHVVFTLPSQLAPLALQNKKIIYDLLLRASAETLLQLARDPRHLGAEIGFFSGLHTCNQKLGLHPHVHCAIPAGGLSLDHPHWIRSRSHFFLPIQVLRCVFRGKFVAGLKHAFQHHQLHFSGNLSFLTQLKIFASWLRPLFRNDWVVYCKPPSTRSPRSVLVCFATASDRVCPPLCWSRKRLSSRLSHLSRLWSPNLLLRSQTQQGLTHPERLPHRIQNP